jgi:glycine cleavage system regulatory protein
MMKSLVITLIGDDRPGIVETVSNILVEHRGDWIESHMSNLAGKFAGILHVHVPAESAEEFKQDILSERTAGLHIRVEDVTAESAAAGDSYRLQLVGQDHPGIVYRISSALANNGATVEELDTEVVEASMSGEQLFKADILLSLREGASIEGLRDVLEELANELIVDIELD